MESQLVDESYDRLISLKEAFEITGHSRSGGYVKLKNDPDYPKPVKDGKLTKFSYRECQAYVRRKLAQRGE
jgi:predicted DNA-binding transcriptional regulator AlpA